MHTDSHCTGVGVTGCWHLVISNTMQREERGRLGYAVNPITSENEQDREKASHDDEQECLCTMALTSNLRETPVPACCHACWHSWDGKVDGTPIHRISSQAARRKQQLSHLAATDIMGLAIPTSKGIASLLGSAFSISFGIMLMTVKQNTSSQNVTPLVPEPLYWSAQQCPNFMQA